MAKTKKTKLNKGRAMGCAFALLCVVIAITFFGRIYGLYQRAMDLSAAQAELANLQEECDKIQEEVDLLEDENYITRYARKNWVFTKEGETVIPLPEDATNANEE